MLKNTHKHHAYNVPLLKFHQFKISIAYGLFGGYWNYQPKNGQNLKRTIEVMQKCCIKKNEIKGGV